jgi:hypothetical protein
MQVPKGLQAAPGKVLRVKKSLYGLKQSGYEWYLEAYKGLEELGLYFIFADTCIFVRKDRKLIVGLYINNIIILADDIQVVRDFKAGMVKR